MYTGDSGCVEASLALDVLVRDFSSDAWQALVGQVKAPS
jgi:hypothetical protein